MVYYIYKIIFLCGESNGRYYIGKHCTNNMNDGYAGSGTFCQRYYKKYGKVEDETYTKEILYYCSSEEELAEKEREIIGNLYDTDPLCMNLKQGGEGGLLSNETKQRVSEATKKAMHNPDVKKKQIKGLLKAFENSEIRQKISKGNRGKKRSEEAKQKNREAHLGKHPSKESNIKRSESLKGRTSPMKGKHQSEEAKLKIGAASKGNQYGKGYHHSQEAKKKISVNNSHYWLGKTGSNKGKHWKLIDGRRVYY